MPSIKIITPILGGNYYHIFNRGINRQEVFFSEENYFYFLKLLDRFLTNYISILAYCLLPNHFHLVIKVNNEIILPADSGNLRIPSFEKDGILITNDEEIGKWVSNQFRKLFISYSMAINKQESRTGSLFDKNFKRVEITENEYLKYAIYYTHYNPEKHGFIQNFENYRFSSFRAISSKRTTKVDKKLVCEIFGGEDEFLHYHSSVHEERELLVLE